MAAFEYVQGPGASPVGFEDSIATFRSGVRQFENSRQLQVLNLELALLGVRDARVRRWLRDASGQSIAEVARDLPGDEAGRLELAALLVALGNGVALLRMLSPEAISIEAAERGLRRLAGQE